MVAFDKDKVISIKLSKLEQFNILRHCPELEVQIKNKIMSAKNDILNLLEEEADILNSIISQNLLNIKDKKITALFKSIIKRLPICNNETTSITELLAEQDISIPKALENFFEKIYKAAPPIKEYLTLEQVKRFQNYFWGDTEFPLQFNPNLLLEDVNQFIFFRNTKLFLSKLIEHKKEPIVTATGNLNRQFVKLMFDEMELEEGYKEKTSKYNKVINETDVFPLHIIRVICEHANLIKINPKKIIVHKKVNEFLSDEKAGQLYFLLFATYYKKFNLAYYSRFPELICIQDTFDFILYRLSVLCNEFQSIDDLYNEIFLPAVKQEIEENVEDRFKELLVSLRIFRPLVNLGLIEPKYRKEKYGNKIEQVRKTPLFDKFISLNL